MQANQDNNMKADDKVDLAQEDLENLSLEDDEQIQMQWMSLAKNNFWW